MQFVFKRDEESRERIYVGDVCVAEVVQRNGGAHIINTGGMYSPVPGLESDASASIGAIEEAYARSDEAGFWNHRRRQGEFVRDEVTVDVPVAETSTTLTLVREDD